MRKQASTISETTTKSNNPTTEEITSYNNNRKPLIIHISSFGGVSYSFNVAYGVGKSGVDRMARDMDMLFNTYYI